LGPVRAAVIAQYRNDREWASWRAFLASKLSASPSLKIAKNVDEEAAFPALNMAKKNVAKPATL
jgi:hypothetical protein